ncbi:MAG: DUF2726 domain-containing protein [Azoarcus sp.]|nr:DUF2726 domain-containing protein [Azoarcus sp.]
MNISKTRVGDNAHPIRLSHGAPRRNQTPKGKTLDMKIVLVIVISALVILLLVRNKQLQNRRRAREAAWFAAAQAQRSSAKTTILGSAPVFRVRPAWISPEATCLYAALAEAFPKMIVFSHVSVARVLYLKGESDWERQSETARQAVDFLICKKSEDNILPAAAVELDDPARKDLRGIGAQKRRAFEEAGIPFLAYAANELPDVNTLRRDVANAIVALGRAAKKPGRAPTPS